VGMSGDRPSRQFAIVAETRRRWSQSEKQAIVTEASAPCTNISAVARRHGMKPSLLFRWIKDFAAGGTEAPRRAGPTFLPVALPAPVIVTPPSANAPAKAAREFQEPGTDGIEIELANGRRVRIGAAVDSAALKRVIDLLEE